MRTVLARNWWSLVIRGVIAILMAIITFVWPGITLAALVVVFGAYALVDGVIGIVGAWRAVEKHERWGALFLEGLVGIAAGLITFFWPALTALALVYIVAAWALVTGAFEIAAAIRLRRYIAGEWLLILSGIASILFGGILMLFPLAGALAIALWVGIYAFVFGLLLITLGFRLRSLSRGLDIGSPHPVPSR